MVGRVRRWLNDRWRCSQGWVIRNGTWVPGRRGVRVVR